MFGDPRTDSTPLQDDFEVTADKVCDYRGCARAVSHPDVLLKEVRTGRSYRVNMGSGRNSTLDVNEIISMKASLCDEHERARADSAWPVHGASLLFNIVVCLGMYLFVLVVGQLFVRTGQPAASSLEAKIERSGESSPE